MHDYIQAMSVMSKNDSYSSGGKVWQLVKAVLPRRMNDAKNSLWSSDLLEMVSLLSHHLRIEKKYFPSNNGFRPNFPLLLFRPSQEELGEHGQSSIEAWNEATNGQVAVVEIPNANHYSVIRNPAVELLASEIAIAIDQTLHCSRLI